MKKKVVGTLVAAGVLVASLGAVSATWIESDGIVTIGGFGKNDHYSHVAQAGYGGGDPKTQLVKVRWATSRVFCMTNDYNENNISAQKQCVQDTTTALTSSAKRDQLIKMHFETAYNNPDETYFRYSWAP
ncbi:hypothetical protein SAMN04487866_1107 [Thermoactinomyces sp. DSM 45891]|uniref:hypothetical protein n=1 Tax=Thermoactinomyces sp. DSM 45891 TaxID=1761907 RepID=UPI0009214296|nr:hypothetical protein [Thermoactinomyces sp. DSM 45891]SFX50978.1 hypothetical protein SAMN04487866_1107 [Thermoactinomyces sp. DSM 45891]